MTSYMYIDPLFDATRLFPGAPTASASKLMPTLRPYNIPSPMKGPMDSLRAQLVAVVL